jgi:hypothetical protein
MVYHWASRYHLSGHHEANDLMLQSNTDYSLEPHPIQLERSFLEVVQDQFFFLISHDEVSETVRGILNLE